MRKIVFILSAVLAYSLLAGCNFSFSRLKDNLGMILGKEAETTTSYDDYYEPETIDNSNEISDSEWASAYYEYLSRNFYEDDEYFTYTLIYVDDNDVPELFISSGIEAGGEIVATYYDGQVYDKPLSRIGTTYIPYSGLMYTDTGHMDYYPVSITELKDGRFAEIASGVAYVSEDALLKFYETGEYNMTYEWNGKAVSGQEFNNNIEAIFDTSKQVFPNPVSTYSQILSELSYYI